MLLRLLGSPFRGSLMSVHSIEILSEFQECEEMVIRPSLVTYVILWILVGLILVPFLTLALGGQRNALSLVIVVALLGVLGTGSLTRIQLRMSREKISYRSVFRLFEIPLGYVSSIQGRFGTDRGPIFALVFEVYPGTPAPSICVNMKLFSKQDLRRLFDLAKSYGIQTRLDDLVARRLEAGGV